MNEVPSSILTDMFDRTASQMTSKVQNDLWRPWEGEELSSYRREGQTTPKRYRNQTHISNPWLKTNKEQKETDGLKYQNQCSLIEAIDKQVKIIDEIH